MAVGTDRFTPANIIANWNDPALYTGLLADLNERLLRQAIERAVPEAEQLRQRAQEAVQAAQPAQQEQAAQDAQRRVQEAQQNLAVAQQRLQVWQTVRATLEAAQVARATLAAAEHAVQHAEADATAQQILQDARQAAEQAEQNAQEAQQALQAAQQAEQNAQNAAQAGAQNPVAKYAPIPLSPALTATLRNAFRGLAQKYQGRVWALDRQADGYIKTRLEIIADRVKQLNCFHSESMQTQFMKLANVWSVWPDLPLDDFNFPVASIIAALLLDRGVIMAAEDVKAVAFDDPKDQQVVRAAEKLVIEKAINLIDPNLEAHRAWLPAQCFTSGGTLLRWWLNYEFDLRIWDYAARMHRGEEIAGDPGLTRWKAEYGQVVRMKQS